MSDSILLAGQRITFLLQYYRIPNKYSIKNRSKIHSEYTPCWTLASDTVGIETRYYFAGRSDASYRYELRSQRES